MLKQLVLLFAIVAATQALPGGWSEQTAITDDVMDLARWTTSMLSLYNKGNKYTIMTVKNVKTQVVLGMNYMFTIDVVVTTADQKNEVIPIFSKTYIYVPINLQISRILRFFLNNLKIFLKQY